MDKIGIAMIVFLVLFYAGLAVFLVFEKKNNRWPFERYERKTGPVGTKPLEGEVRDYTPEEIEKRDKAVEAARNNIQNN